MLPARMSDESASTMRTSRSRQDGSHLRAPGLASWTVGAVDVSGLSTSLTNVSTARVQLEVSAAVLDRALESTSQQASALLEALSVDEPAGLTFSPKGLSPGRTSRFVADL